MAPTADLRCGHIGSGGSRRSGGIEDVEVVRSSRKGARSGRWAALRGSKCEVVT